MANETVLRQAKNSLHIEGVLSEKNLEVANFNRKGAGQDDAIKGRLTIEVAPNEVHTVNVFAYQHTRDGKVNSVFKGLETVMNEYKSISEDGRENADKVRVSSGQLGVNEYIGNDGALRSFTQISTNFVNRVTASDKDPYAPKATFDVEGYIKSVKHETKNDDETGRLLVNIVIPEYGGRVAEVQFVVNESLADDFEDLYPRGASGEFQGDVINFSETVKKLQKGGIGKPKEEVTHNVKREMSITWASEPFEEENKRYFNPATIKAALVEHETYIEGLKNGSSSNSGSGNSTKSGGIGSKPSESTTIDISDDDLPF
jgi:hypothetical protein